MKKTMKKMVAVVITMMAVMLSADSMSKCSDNLLETVKLYAEHEHKGLNADKMTVEVIDVYVDDLMGEVVEYCATFDEGKTYHCTTNKNHMESVVDCIVGR